MAADEGYFGEQVAAVYDAQSEGMFHPAVIGPAVERLAELADGGRALEFAVGTGRIALPLAEHRWGGWRREPFTALSPSHVSVYVS